MNQPFTNNPVPSTDNVNTQAPQSTGWAPQPITPVPVAPAPIPTQPVSSPFEASPIPNITGPVSAPPSPDNIPVMMEPAGPKSNTWLFVMLAIIIIGGLIFLANSMGWINISKLMGGKVTPTPTPTVSVPVIVVNKNDATRKTDLINLKTALNQYYNVKQAYPVSISVSKTSDTDSALKVLVPDYIPSLPIDPLSPTYYYGYKSADGTSFELTAVLEDESDSAGAVVGNYFLYIVTDYSQETPSVSDPSAAALTDTTTDTTTDPSFDINSSTDATTDATTDTSVTDFSADASATAVTP